MSKRAPTLPAYVIPATPRRHAQAVLWCGWCEEPHFHGAGDGNRSPHCSIPDSGHRVGGYDLATAGEIKHEREALPKAAYAGKRQLRKVLDGLSLPFRAVLLRRLLGLKRAGGSVQKTVHGHRVWVFGPASWSIEPPETKPGEGLGFLTCRTSPIAAGEGLSGLAAHLFGISRGIVAARMLQAVTLDPYDAQALQEIAAAVDSWARRQDANGGAWWRR